MIRVSEEVRKPTFSNHPTEVKMEKRELAEKIVLAMIQSGLIKFEEIKCSKKGPVSAENILKMKDRASAIESLIKACASELSSLK